MSKIIEEFERKVVAMIIEDLIKAGFCLQLEDDMEEVFEIHNTNSETLDEICDFGEQRIYVYQEDGDDWFGWVFLVFGNGEYIISNYTVNLEQYLKRANDFCALYM